MPEQIEKMKDLFKDAEIKDFEAIIKGTQLDEKMVKNIKSLYFTNEVVSIINSILTHFTMLFYEDIDTPSIPALVNPLPNQVIVGPYGTGKTHLMMFIGFLLGYKMDDDQFVTKFPTLKEDCWKLFEEKGGKDQTGKNYADYFLHFRQKSNDFVVIFRNLTLGGYKEFDKVIAELVNDKFRELSVPEEDLFIISEDILLEGIKVEDMYSAWKVGIEYLKKKGIIFLLEEFLKYFEGLANNDTYPYKKRTANSLQALSDDAQAHCNVGVILITQEELRYIDYLKKISDRLNDNELSFDKVGEIIKNRFFFIPQEKLSAIYEEKFKRSQNHQKAKIKERDFMNFFPFHPDTIWCIKTFLKFYTNPVRGFAHYVKYCLDESYDILTGDMRNIDSLVTADSIYDFLDLTKKETAKDEERERFDRYNMVLEETIKNQDLQHQELLSKLFKVIVVFSSEEFKWDRETFFSHFSDYPLNVIQEQWDILSASQRFITEKEEKIYYNPAQKGDVKKYTENIMDILNSNGLSKQLLLYRFNKVVSTLGGKISSDPSESGIEYNLGKGEKTGIIKYFFLENHSDLKETLEELIDTHLIQSMLNLNLKDLPLVSYTQGIIIFCNFNFPETIDVEEIIDEILNSKESSDFPNDYINNNREIIKKSILFIKPSIIDEETSASLKEYTADWITRRIIELAQNNSSDSIIEMMKNFEKMNIFNAIEEGKSIEFRNIIKRIKDDDPLLRKGYLNALFKVEEVVKKINQSTLGQYTKGFQLGINNWQEWRQINEGNCSEIRNNIFLEKLYPKKYPCYYITDSTQGVNKCLIEFFVASPRNYTSFFNDYFKILIPNIDSEGVCNLTNITKRIKDFAEKTLKKINVVEEVGTNKIIFNKLIEIDCTHLSHFFELFNDENYEDNLTVETVIRDYCLPPYGYPPLFTLLLLFILYKLDKIKISFEDISLNPAVFTSQNVMKVFYDSNKQKVIKDINQITITKPDLIAVSKMQNLFKFFDIIFQTYQENRISIGISPILCNEYNGEIKDININQSNQEKIVNFISKIPFLSISTKMNDSVSDSIKNFNDILNPENQAMESENIETYSKHAMFSFQSNDFFDDIQLIVDNMASSIEDNLQKLEGFYDQFQAKFITEGNWDAFFGSIKIFWNRILKIKKNFVSEGEF